MPNVLNELAYRFGLALPYMAGSVRPSSKSRDIYSLLLVGAAAQVEDDGTKNKILVAWTHVEQNLCCA